KRTSSKRSRRATIDIGVISFDALIPAGITAGVNVFDTSNLRGGFALALYLANSCLEPHGYYLTGALVNNVVSAGISGLLLETSFKHGIELMKGFLNAAVVIRTMNYFEMRPSNAQSQCP